MTHAGPFFHGGTPGLIPGDRLTPHPELAHSLLGEMLWTLSRDPQRNDRVFFTDHLPWAVLYAHWYAERHQGTPGVVYEVIPVGLIEPDDSERLIVNMAGLINGTAIPAQCYRAPAATVLRVAAWRDGTNWCDASGMLVS
jgi:hypothetical protein